jgi:predicted dehydrogenase/nucleoside-diphosphate-sugar epimerase
MKVALVGCGQISKAHVDALKQIEDAAVCAICDLDRFRAQEIADLAGGAQVFGDLAMLLSEAQPNVVHILTPPTSHAALAIQAMEAGCHILVEKPMALNSQEANRMVEVARANGVKLGVNHNYLFKPSVARARELVASGVIGQVVYVDGYYGLAGEGGAYPTASGRSHWAWRLPGGVFTNFLPHLVYLLRAFLPGDPAVKGVSVIQTGQPDAPVADLTVLLESEQAASVMTVSTRAKPYAKFVDIYGTHGIVHADLVREVCTLHRQLRLPRMASKVVFNLEDSFQLSTGTIANVVKVLLGRMKNMPGFHVLIREFYAALRSDQAPPVPGEDGAAVTALMEAVWAQTDALSTQPAAPQVVGVREEPRTAVERSIVEQGGITGKALVTGATGFLGYHLAAALARCGADVVALVRDEACVSPDLRRRAQIVCGDLRDRASIAGAMQGIELVYHCAAITTNRIAWENHLAVNVRGTEIVLEEALKAGVKRAICVSSVIVYGLDQPRRARTVSEDDLYNREPHRWAYYMRSKLAADRLALRFNQENDLAVTVVRPGILYGPGKSPPGEGFLQAGRLRFIIGGGRNRLPFTYVGNAVDCLLLAAISPQAAGQAYNVVDEPQRSVRETVRICRAVTGDKVTLIPVPPLLFNGMALFFEAQSSLNGSGNPARLSRSVVHGAYRNIRYDTTKARQELGWQPEVTLEEGIRRTVTDVT